MTLCELLQKYSKAYNNSQKLVVSTFESPIGNLVGIADEEHLYMVGFEDSRNFERMLQALQLELLCSFVESKENKVLFKLEQELAAYFDGKLKKFTIPLRIKGSEFQKEVWQKLEEIPYSSTQTYGEVATALGRAGGARAVGGACGANAHILLIPCHRLVASRSKGGFSCGLDRKEWLLQHEKKHAT